MCLFRVFQSLLLISKPNKSSVEAMAQFLKLFYFLFVVIFNSVVCCSSKNDIVKRSPEQNAKISLKNATEQNIRDIFKTDFGPGVHIFKNAPPFANEPDNNSHNNEMVSDQPSSHKISPSTPSANVFKVQRSPTGHLELFFNESHIAKVKEDRTMTAQNTKQDSGSNKENRPETNFSEGGSSLNEQNFAISSSENHLKMPSPADIEKCLEKESNSLFCNNIENYPSSEYLEKLIQEKFPNLQEGLFGGDAILPSAFENRMRDSTSDEYLCESYTSLIFPKAGKSEELGWVYVVNAPAYKQGVVVEQCKKKDGAVCGESVGLSLPNKVEATCKQNYIYRTLLVYANDTIVKDTIRLPSCCKCALRYV